MELVNIMGNAYHYQHTFKDKQAEEFRDILSMPFDPLHLDGLKLWLDANDLSKFTVDGSNNVSQWDDKSGLGHHAVQGISADQPVSGQETLDDKNGIFFDYLSKHWMTSGYLPQSEDSLTAFILARRVDDSTPYGGGSVYKTLLSCGRPDTAGPEVGKFNVAENRDTGRLQTVSHLTNAYNSPEGGMLDGRAHIISSRLSLGSNPDHLIGRSDGIEEEFDDMYDTPVADDILPFEICGSTSAGSRRFWGTIFEILIYDQPLSDADILKVELYLAEKWHCYHPQAAWILEYDAVTQAAIHAGKLSRDDISTTASPLLLWLDAEDASTITLDGNKVTQWDDKSPHALHHDCEVAVQQPDYDAIGMNGKPAIVFEGVENALNEYLQAESGFPQLTGFTMFIVNAHDTANGVSSHICYEIGNQVLLRWEYNMTNNLTLRTRDSLNWEPTIYTGEYPVGQASLITASYDLTELSISRNAGTPVTVAKTDAIDPGLGWGRINRAGTGGAGEQSVSEIILFDRMLDAAQIASIQAYLIQKWSIT